MFLKPLLVVGVCLLANPTYAATCQIPPTAAQPFVLTEACIDKTPELQQALLDLLTYWQTAKPLIRQETSTQRRTLEQLLHWVEAPQTSDAFLPETLQLEALGAPDDDAYPVELSGYFTPVIDVSATPTAAFRYPIYDKPKYGALPSRAEIMQGALHGKGLEIAWTNNPVDYYFMQVQGSGLIRYADGRTQLLGFSGKNTHPYASIGRYMQQKGYLRTENLSNEAVREWLNSNPHKLDEVLNANQSFVFFRAVKDVIRSAFGLPVVAGYTASVDNSVIPFGSILLVELPLRDNKGKIVQHEWRLLLATDRRSDEQGITKIGIYTGEGEEARAAAQRFFPAGRAFILRSGS